MPELENVVIYVDGGCIPNPGAGGWAAVLMCNGQMKEISGSCPNTTNNRMELTAAIESLKILKRKCKIEVFCDSKYVVNGISTWIHNWRNHKNWRETTKNSDLWEELYTNAEMHEITWTWVKGHAGNQYNERCDELAEQAIAKLTNQDQWRTN